MKRSPVRSSRAFLLRTAIALTLSLFSAFARSQVTTDTLPRVRLPEIVISALRIPFNENTAPYSVSVINVRPNLQGLSLAESLAGLPGLSVNARYNYAVGDRITNRGFGARTQFGVRGIRILFDDIPVTFADGQTNLEMIDLQNLSYAEFLRGPGSALYGNASGGVLLLYSKEITDNHLKLSAYTTTGSNGLFRWNGQLEAGFRKVGLSMIYSQFEFAGFRDHSEASSERAFLKISSNLTSKDNLLIESGLVKFNAMNPGSLTKSESLENPGMANPSSINNQAGQSGNQAQIATSWKHRIDSVSSLRLSAYAIHRSVNNPIIGKIINLPQYSGGLTSSYSSAFAAGSKTLEWNTGIEFACRLNNRKNYLNNSGIEGDLIIDQDEQVLGSGAFLQLKYPFTRNLSIDACLRYDLSYFAVQNHRADSLGKGKRYMNALNPSAGLTYSLTKDLRFFANISTSFETPTSTELVNRPETAGGFNPDLDPSHATEYEAGIRGSYESMLSYDLAFYLIRTRDELIPFQVANNPGQDFYRNAGTTIHKGGEASVRFNPADYFDFNLTLTYVDAYYSNFTVKGSDYSGKKIPGLNKFHSQSEFKLSNAGFYFSLILQSFGRMYVDDANSETAGKYLLTDLSLGHREFSLGRSNPFSFSLSGGISNLFSIRYISAVTINAAASRYYEPGPGRTFFVNCRINFTK